MYMKNNVLTTRDGLSRRRSAPASGCEILQTMRTPWQFPVPVPDTNPVLPKRSGGRGGGLSDAWSNGRTWHLRLAATDQRVVQILASRHVQDCLSWIVRVSVAPKFEHGTDESAMFIRGGPEGRGTRLVSPRCQGWCHIWGKAG